ncbi:leucine-rich repeat-containing G-protein coupled receptor 4-like [Ochlerotatus camptorhynchus]|uniref:leucine-rich repeat-containing G-protein coupled receptor 4-like n=1 Tax=Ochlerotatus camptorhynchus TaxID=644619 RepID=UPI0031E125A0
MIPLRTTIALLLLVAVTASLITGALAVASTTFIKLNCETKNRVCYLKNIYATEDDRFKDVYNAEHSDIIEFFDCHIHTLPKIPFIKSVEAKGINLVKVVENTFSTIQHLDVSYNRLRDISTKAFEWPAELQTLVASGNPLLKDLSFLKALIGLMDLQLSDMKLDLDFIDVDIFSGMKLLKTLTMSNNKIVTVPVGIFNKLESLEKLDLSKNYISRISSGAFIINFRTIDPEIEQRHQLTINLASNNISIIEKEAFMIVDMVDLSDNKLIGISPTAFYNKSELGTLILSNNRQLKNFNFLKSLPSLHTLTMAHMNFTFNGIPLDIFSELDLLTTLDLSFNDISQLPIGIFSDLSSLNFINLRHNRISHVEFGTFSIRKYDLIDEIDLSYNDITDVNYLVFVPFKYLRTLLLHGNQITYVNANHLKRNKSLQNFGIQHNPIRCSDLIDLLAIFKLVLDGREFVAHEPNIDGIKCNP